MSGIFDQVINYAPPSLLTGTVTYKGTWSAATNTPTLANPPAAITNGHYYVVSAGGTQFSLVFNIGDWIISNGSAWEKVDNTDAVDSVFGRTGAVVGVSTDYSAVGITNTALGASNPSTVAATTITASSTIAATGAVTGSNLSGTNTGDQTITLTGGVTGSGTGSFAATVVTNANLTGDVTSSGNATTLTNAPVIAKVLTGYTSGAGTVAATDSILQAIQKLNGNDGTNANLTGVITSSGNATSIASQTGTGTKFVVDTSPTLVTPNIGIATGTSLAAALNGTLGATTPSTIAGTTGTFSGNVAVGSSAVTISTGGSLTAIDNVQVNSGTIRTILTFDTGVAVIGSYTNHPVSLRVNQTQVGQLTTTGLNSTAIGATTPSTGAFSTLSATGTAGINNIAAGFGSSKFAVGTTSDADPIAIFRNVGSGTQRGLYVTANNTTGDVILNATGASAGNMVLQVGGTEIVRIASSATGLAITGTLSATGALAIGNTVNTVTATLPNRTITMVIGGTTYYLHAKTTND